MPRTILFVDPPAFCTTIESLVAPDLRTRPVAVAPPGAERAVVLALSTEARRAGIAKGMVVRQALKQCPDLVIIPPNPRLYARASRALHEILRAYAPVIEPHGYGHAFLDLTGTGRLFGPPEDVAMRVRREVRERLRFPLSVGVAANKLVSQAAVRADRWSEESTEEDALVVPFGIEARFLAPKPLIVMPDLHPRIRSRLDDYQLDLIGEVAAIPESALCTVFGNAGSTLRARALGIDPRPVLPPERLAELTASHILATDTNDLGRAASAAPDADRAAGPPAPPRQPGGPPATTGDRLRRPHRVGPHGAALPFSTGCRSLGRRPPRLLADQCQADRGAGSDAEYGKGGGDERAVGAV